MMEKSKIELIPLYYDKKSVSFVKHRNHMAKELKEKGVRLRGLFGILK
jgi:hypothetical protein